MSETEAMNRNGYISLGTGVSVILAIVAACVWINQQLSANQISTVVNQKDIQTSIIETKTAAQNANTELAHYKEIEKLSSDLILSKIENLSEKVGAASSDRFTGHDHKIFTERLQELNPSIKVPKPQ